MTWQDFYRYVLPHCQGCPDDTIDQYLRAAAIEFCSRTGCWTRTLDEVTVTADVTTIALPLDEGQEVARIEFIKAGELEYDITDRRTALDRQRRGLGGRVAWTDDRQEIGMYPMPAAGTVVTIDVVLKPSEDADGIDDDVGLQHIRAIASGALAELLDLKATWRDTVKAATEHTKFQNAIGRAAFNEMRGHGPRLARKGPPTF